MYYKRIDYHKYYTYSNINEKQGYDKSDDS